MSESSVIWFICGPDSPVSSDIPSFSIQSKPSRGLVFFVVFNSSSSILFPFISTDAVAFPSNFIQLSFTSLCSVPIGLNGVVPLNCDFGINVTREPLSIMSLIGRLFTNAVIVKIPDQSSWFGVLNGPFDLLNGLCLVTNRHLPRCLPRHPVYGLFVYMFSSILRSVQFSRILHISSLWLDIRVVLSSWVLRIDCSLFS